MSRRLRLTLQIAVSGAVVAYLVWQIDIRATFELIADANVAYVVAALAIFLGTTWVMAWRWQILLESKGLSEPLGWLTKLYFVGYAASQVLPTAVGGDAVRIFEHARRRPDERAEVAAAVIMERVLGAIGTLLLVAAALLVAAGRYDAVSDYVWLEALFLAGTALFLAAVFSRKVQRYLERWLFPLGRRLRIDHALRTVWAAMHTYRSQPGALALVLVLTIGAQGARIAAIWLCGEAVGIEVTPVAYLLLGPLLFLVQMIPFTLNGLGVREAFFVGFLGRFDVPPDAALAAGILFYAVTIATSLPGGLILLWRSIRPAAPAQ